MGGTHRTAWDVKEQDEKRPKTSEPKEFVIAGPPADEEKKPVGRECGKRRKKSRNMDCRKRKERRQTRKGLCNRN